MIDEALPEEWPHEVVDAAQQFQQGDLVQGPPFFYTACAQYGVLQLTRDTGDVTSPEEIFEVDIEFRPPFGMITTETCDLTEEGRNPARHPLISIAPVYDVSERVDANAADLLDRNMITYLRLLESGLLPSGLWVVDARIEVPVEKSWLVGKEPIRVSVDAESRAAIAGFLAGRRDRPVLSDSLHRALITQVRRWLEGLSTTRRARALDGVAEVRLMLSGPPSDPDGAGLILIGDGDPIPDTVGEEWDRKWENWRERTERVDIALVKTAYETYDSLSARQYRESFPLSLDIRLS